MPTSPSAIIAGLKTIVMDPPGDTFAHEPFGPPILGSLLVDASESVATLLPGLVSVNPAGALTVAVFMRVPAAFAEMFAVTV